MLLLLNNGQHRNPTRRKLPRDKVALAPCEIQGRNERKRVIGKRETYRVFARGLMNESDGGCGCRKLGWWKKMAMRLGDK
jgi:hypothetical protein